MPLKQIVFRGNGQHFSVQPTHLLQILRALGLITGSAERSGGHDGKSRAAEEESIGLHEHAEVPRKNGLEHGHQTVPDHVQDQCRMIHNTTNMILHIIARVNVRKR